MANFSSMPGPGTTPGVVNALGLTAAGQPLGIDNYDANMAFDESLLDSVHNLSGLPFTPTYDFDAFGATFEDPFSYTARSFGDNTALTSGDITESYNGEAVSPQELDNKLLGFGIPIPGKATLIDSTGQFVSPSMTAELYGMFFVAEDVFVADNSPNRPLELTCYRRNLWQCSGQITLPRHVAQYIDEQGRQAPAIELAASITGMESMDGKAAEIISIPWKSSNPALGGVDSEPIKSAGAPPIVPLDLSSGQEMDDGSNQISIPVAWKRLQFKHATANNGRRKGLQQHYVVQINLLVKAKNGEYIKISEIQSGPVIVRGRSPRNFDSRKDVPLTGGVGDKRAIAEKRSIDGLSGPSTGPIRDIPRYHQQPDWSSSTPRQFNSQSQPQQQEHPNKKLAVSSTSPNLNRPPVPSWGSLESHNNNNAFTHNNSISKSSSSMSRPLPISLSLSEEDNRSPPTSTTRSNSSGAGGESPLVSKPLSSSYGKGKETAAHHQRNSFYHHQHQQQQHQPKQQQQPQQHRMNSGGSTTSNNSDAAGNHNNPLITSPLETADMLYEYFPLSVDDWMPPVDAIYRPHVVHHTIVPPEVKAQQVRSKTKRYFAAE
ncbi:protein pacG [Podospora fimiseda]|uniref:Protein pacG n=1 Tax=Podospora fimiseda TaxID=252190 RepID=A0AAN7BZK4_9PEZI|nr:protein pacG [Podospora fimiseda]